MRGGRRGAKCAAAGVCEGGSGKRDGRVKMDVGFVCMEDLRSFSL